MADDLITRFREIERMLEELDDRIDSHDMTIEKLRQSIVEMRNDIARLMSRETTCGLTVDRLERVLTALLSRVPEANDEKEPA